MVGLAAFASPELSGKLGGAWLWLSCGVVNIVAVFVVLKRG
jgi:hypothetical protein